MTDLDSKHLHIVTMGNYPVLIRLIKPESSFLAHVQLIVTSPVLPRLFDSERLSSKSTHTCRYIIDQRITRL